MSIEPTTVETPPAPPSFKEEAATYALVSAAADALKDYAAKVRRPRMFALLKEKYDVNGDKSANVFLDGEVVGTATVTEPKGKVAVTDEDALIEWVSEHFPTEIQVTPQINPAFHKQLLEKLVEPIDKKAAGEVYVKDTTVTQAAEVVGEAVPGVGYQPPAEPTSFSLTWKSKEQKRAALERVLSSLGPALGVDTAAAILDGEASR